jgi:hypothetical protein
MTSRRWLLAIVLCGAVLRFVPIWFGLPLSYARPDETTALGLAENVRRGDPNPHFFHWPSLAVYLFAAVNTLGSLVRRVLGLDPEVPFAQLIITGRAVVALVGTLTLVVVFDIARRMGGVTAGLMAALFLAVAILHVRESHFAMTDVLMTFFLTLSIALLVRALEARPEHRPRAFAIAGITAGLATSTKYNAAAILSALAATQLILLVSRERSPWSPRAWIPSIAFVAGFLGAFVLGTPFSVLDFTTFKNDIIFDITHLSDGHAVDVGRGWEYHLRYTLPYGLSIPIFAAALAGIGLSLRESPRYAFVLWTFALSFYVVLGSGKTVFFRYVLPLVPLLCVAAGIAVERLASWISARWSIRPGRAAAGLAAVFAAVGLVNSIWFDVLLARTDSRVIAARWLAARMTPTDSLCDSGSEYVQIDLSGVEFDRRYYDVRLETFDRPQDPPPVWIVLYESPLSYTPVYHALATFTKTHYDLVLTVPASNRAARASVYDKQDAFFLPISGFAPIRRPGPTIRVYRHRDAPPLPGLTQDEVSRQP